jgi:putative phage-type endonuclease
MTRQVCNLTGRRTPEPRIERKPDTVIPNHPSASGLVLHPDAIEVDHIVDPNDPDSYAEWLSYMTGSKVAAVLGISLFTTRLELWRQMTGRDVTHVDNAYTAHGREREPVIREATAAELGIVIHTPRMLVSKHNPRHAYSADGIFEDPSLWECKTATLASADKWKHGIPAHYAVQWQWGSYVTGLKRGLFTLEPHDDFLPVWTADYHISRDDKRIAEIVDAVEEFLTYVDSDTPPPPIGARVVTDPDDVDTIRRWAKDNAQRLDVEKHIKEARPLIDRLGQDATALMTEDGDVLCHWIESHKSVDHIDWDAIEAENRGAAKAASRTYIDHDALAHMVPDAVKEHTTATTTITRSLRQGARK